MRYGKLMMIRSTDKDRFKSFADLDKAGTRIAYNKGGLNESFAKTMFTYSILFTSRSCFTAKTRRCSIILISGSIRSSSTARSPKSGPSGSVTSNNQGEKRWHVFRLSTART